MCGRDAGYSQRKILRKGDYYNLAQLLGKTHMEYVSPFNSTILRKPDGELVDWNHVNFVGEVHIDLQARVSLPQWHHNCDRLVAAAGSIPCLAHSVNLLALSLLVMTALILLLQEFVPLVKAAVMSACGDCYQACGPVNAKGEVDCVPAQTGAGKLAKAGLIN